MSARTPKALERNRVASRDAKRRRTGTCVDCGQTTRYNGHGPAVSERCRRCAALHAKADLRGRGPSNSRVLELLANGPARYTEIADHLGLDRQRMGPVLVRLMRYGLIVRPSRGVYALPEND